MLLAGGDILLLEALIALHDIADVVDTGQKRAETVGMENDGQNVVAAVLLHGAHAGAVALKLLVLQRLGRFDLFLLFFDHAAVDPELLVRQLDLLAQIAVALVVGGLLFDQRGLPAFELRDRVFALLGFGGKLLLTRLQLFEAALRVDGEVLLAVGVDARGQHTHDEPDEHQHREQDRDR